MDEREKVLTKKYKGEHPVLKKERARQEKIKRHKQYKEEKPVDVREADYVAQRSKPGVSRAEARARAGFGQLSKEKERRLEEQVRENISAQFKKNNLTAERVLLEVWRMALVDVADLFDEDGNLLPLSALDEDTRRAITGAEIHRIQSKDGVDTYAHKVRTAKERALEMLMKHFGKLGGDGEEKKRDRLDEVIDAMREIPQQEKEK